MISPEIPKLNPGALTGLAGSIIKGLEPHTEADNAALLSQLLAVYGNLIGRSPHFIAEADRHGTNLFVLNVGDTSKGRKGSSWGHIEGLARAVDPDWLKDRVKSGLSSGEGLIEAVKDYSTEDGVIHGTNDKRILCLESEFGSTLRVIGREGNILSPVLRNAWDGKNLSILTRQLPIQATDPHISAIGHITKFELNKLLSSNDISNGLGCPIPFFGTG